MKWISIKNSMPDIGTTILVLNINDKCMDIVNYQYEQNGYDGRRVLAFWSTECREDIYIFPASHWMPLPKIPKE